MFTAVGSLIKGMPFRSKTPGAILALQVRQVAKDSLRRVCSDLGSDILDGVKIKSFKSGVLTMSASGLLSAELQMRSGGLMEEINKTLRKRIVYRLRFRVG